MKKIVIDGRKRYVKGPKEHEADGIELCDTTSYTLEEKASKDQMSCMTKNANRTRLLYSDPHASSRPEFYYMVCNADNGVVRAGMVDNTIEAIFCTGAY